MIRIENKKDCCGCGACEQICPKRCISLIEDSQGFLYPEADASLCVECGLCERVCPAAKPNHSCETCNMYTVDDQLCHDRSDSEPLLAVTHGKFEGQPNVSDPLDVVTFNKLHGQPDAPEPLEVLAAKNPDSSVRKCSSSGGVFSLLAESVIEDGGVVFGAMFNDSYEVVHGYVETKDQLAKLRGSKYVHSRVGNCFREVEQFLKEGRKVLFSGTPCQVAGLRKFLNLRGLSDRRVCRGTIVQSAYTYSDSVNVIAGGTDDIGNPGADSRNCLDNLLLVDIVCHGVPSPMVWRHYLSSAGGMAKSSPDPNSKYNSNNNSVVNFRDKSRGWRNYRVVIDGKSEYYARNPFMAGFLQNYYLRPSCYSCPIKVGRWNNFKSLSSHHSKCADVPTVFASDITLGDYWGIEAAHPEFFDDGGVSLVIVNTSKGVEAMSRLAVDSLKSDFASALRKNPSIVSNPELPAGYDDFWTAYKKEGVAAIGKFATTPSNISLFKSRLRCLIRRLLNKLA